MVACSGNRDPDPTTQTICELVTHQRKHALVARGAVCTGRVTHVSQWVTVGHSCGLAGAGRG